MKQSVHLKIMLVMLNLQALSIIMIVPNPSLTVFPVRQMTETEIDGIVFHFFLTLPHLSCSGPCSTCACCMGLQLTGNNCEMEC